MVLLLVLLTLILCTYAVGFWSTRIYPAARPFRYSQTPDIQLPDPRETLIHKNLAVRFHLYQHTRVSLSDSQSIDSLMAWVHNLWQPQLGRFANSDNPLSVISRALNGERFTRSDYNLILAHAMMAVGIPCRLTSLRTRDCSWRPLASQYQGIEYFDREHCKWVWHDAQFGVRVLQNDVPLNSLEIKQAYLNREILTLTPDQDTLTAANYVQQLIPFLDIVVACPMGQTKKFALIPPQLKLFKKQWLFGPTLYDTRCSAAVSFYASHPAQQLTQPAGRSTGADSNRIRKSLLH
jgi:hypothetical protein